MEIRINDKYIISLNERLGKGAFGQIYKGVHLKTNQEVAIKIEQNKNKPPLLKEEFKILNYLRGETGIPDVLDIISEGCYNLLILELLGPNLEDLFKYYGHIFTQDSIITIGEQILIRLELMHSRHFIHRDIKPENFVIGIKEKKNIIYLIDFGLSKRFRHSKTGEHVPYRDGRSFCGTARYASIYTHLGIDDLESLGYSLMYFLRGNLPWQRVKGKCRKDKYERIMQIKIENTPDKLCEGYPEQLNRYFHYCRNLQFEEKPDYNYLKELLRSVCPRKGESSEINVFEWTMINASSNNFDNSDDENKSKKRNFLAHNSIY